MRTIYKYELEVDERDQTLPLPDGAEILTVQAQGDSLCLWAQAESSHLEGNLGWQVDVVGTGRPANYSRKAYVGTVQLGDYVWHVFAWPRRTR